MSEWWTYRPSDFLMFSARTYYRMFELYNRALWPAQLVALALGVLLVAALARRPVAVSRPAARDRLAAAILGVAWLWVAVAFHLERFARIHTGARYFAAAGVVEAVLLGFCVARPPAEAGRASLLAERFGLGIAAGAVGLLPLVGPLLGRDWHQVELFGLAPDPTALATLGALLVVRGRRLALAWVVPLLWCLFAGLTLWTLGARDFWVLPLAAGVAVVAAVLARPSAARPARPAR